MGVYTCTKPACFAGVKYKPGDVVPAETIPADRVSAVIRLGLIAEAQPGAADQQPPTPAEPPAPAPFTVPITLEDGTVSYLEITPEAAAEAIGILQMTVDDAADRIKGITDGAALIVIDACDSRKTVKKAAAARAAELEEPGNGEPPATEEPGNGKPRTAKKPATAGRATNGPARLQLRPHADRPGRQGSNEV